MGRGASAVTSEGFRSPWMQSLEFRSAKVSKKIENKEFFALKIVNARPLFKYFPYLCGQIPKINEQPMTKIIKEQKITGNLDIKGLNKLLENEYEFLDISEAEMGIDQEQWEVCLGWSHHGPVYGNSGWRKVEVLKRLLEQINAKTILLPDNVMRRHINAAKKNPHIKELQVSPNCPLFAYEDGKLMNKKKTLTVFESKRRE